MINANLVQDWNDFLQREMPALGLRHDPALSAEDNTLRYLNVKRRTPRQAPRSVHEARELKIPPAHADNYAVLKKLIWDGGDLIPYLSRDIRNSLADKNDRLLNAWGIHHLHFCPNGARDVLFAKFTDTEAFVLQSLPHGAGYPDTWVETSLLEILHNNWPEVAGGRITGIAGEVLTSSQRVALRRRNANFATEMPDGTVYLGDGGLTASGNCLFDVRESDKVFADLVYWQKVIEDNEANIREALGVPLPQELSIKLMVTPDSCWLYEPVRQRRLSLTFQP
jgi:hypothetical protein